jgi:long-subunit fatty acid transport protein
LSRPHLFTKALSALALALSPVAAKAAGLDLPENGAVPLARGGTAVSGAGDAYSLQFNPAALTSVDGLDVRLDWRFVGQEVTFARAGQFEPVSNSAGVFNAPALHVAYRPSSILGGKLAFGLGAWGPPGVGRAAFPDPADVAKDPKLCLNPDKPDEIENACVSASTGQRYSLIKKDTLTLFASFGIAYQLHPRLSLGVTLQNAISSFAFSQSLAVVAGAEDVLLDARISLAVTQRFNPTGILALSATPHDKLRIGAMFRPKVKITGTGTLDIALPAAASAANISVAGNGAKLELNFPAVLRVGATWTEARWNASAELVYEGWSANDKLVLTPDVRLVQNGTESPIAPFNIDKNWVDSYGARVGGTFTALQDASGKSLLDLHVGGLYASNAIPASKQAVDFIGGDQLAVSGGLSAHAYGFTLSAGAMYYKPVSVTVTDSTVKRGSASPENPPVIVGNGKYDADSWVVAVGLGYTWGPAPASEAPKADAPAPAPVDAPKADAPAPAPQS